MDPKDKDIVATLLILRQSEITLAFQEKDIPCDLFTASALVALGLHLMEGNVPNVEIESLCLKMASKYHTISTMNERNN
jgi:hypothetical protein